MNGTGPLDRLFRGENCLQAYGRVSIENIRVTKAAVKNCSAALWPTGFTAMVGMRASSGVSRPVRCQLKSQKIFFHLMSARGYFSHVGSTIIWI